MTKHLEKFSLLLVLLLAVFLRLWHLGTNPVSLYWDEAAIALDAYSISQTGRDMNNHHWLQPVLGSYGDFKAPVLIWLTTLSVKAFGMEPWAVRLPVALFSTLTVYLVYLLVKKVLNFDSKLLQHYQKLPFLSALVVAISPWSVHFGRIAFESSLSVAVLLLTLISFLHFLHLPKRRWPYLLLAAVLAALAAYTYYSLRLVLPLLALGLLLVFYRQLKPHLLLSAAGGIIFLLLLVPLFTSPYYQRSQDYRLNNNNLLHHRQVIEESSQYLERYQSSWWAKLLYHRYLFWARDFLSNWSDHFSISFLFLRGDENLRQHSGFLGEFFLILLPLYAWGIWALLRRPTLHLSRLLLALVILSPIPAAMVYETPHASRAIYLFVPFSILIAVGWQELWNAIARRSWGWAVKGAVIAALGVNALFYYADYFIDYPRRSGEAWLYSYNQVAAYIREHHQEYGQIEIDEHYWFPRIFVYYHIPEVLTEARDLKQAFLNSPVNSFDLPDPFMYLLDANNPRIAKFMHYDKKMPATYQQVATFDFPDGSPSMVLWVSEVK